MRRAKAGLARRVLMVGAMDRASWTAREPFCSRDALVNSVACPDS